MKFLKSVLLVGVLAAAAAIPVMAQVHKYFNPGTVWTVTMVKMTSGMDQMYLQYLDTSFKNQRTLRSRPALRNRTRSSARWTTVGRGTC
jgi:hypothetical protein